MFYYFYKITNNINNKYYYGVHQTDDLNDGYMGSGKYLHRAYNKYGQSNFTKEIIRYFDNANDMFKYESVIVNDDLVKDPNCYNIAIGGYGGNLIAGYSDEEREIIKQKIRESQSGKTHSEETKQRMCKPKSEEHKQHIREAKLGKNNPMYGKPSPNKGKHWKTVDGKRVWY